MESEGLQPVGTPDTCVAATASFMHAMGVDVERARPARPSRLHLDEVVDRVRRLTHANATKLERLRTALASADANADSFLDVSEARALSTRMQARRARQGAGFPSLGDIGDEVEDIFEDVIEDALDTIMEPVEVVRGRGARARAAAQPASPGRDRAARSSASSRRWSATRAASRPSPSRCRTVSARGACAHGGGAG